MVCGCLGVVGWIKSHLEWNKVVSCTLTLQQWKQDFKISLISVVCFFCPQFVSVRVKLRWSCTGPTLGSWSPLPHPLPCAVSPPESIQTVAWGPAWTPHWGPGLPLGDQRPAENNGEPHLSSRSSLSLEELLHLPTLSITPRWWTCLRGPLSVGTYLSTSITHVYVEIENMTKRHLVLYFLISN